MKKVTLKLSRLTVPAKIEKARHFVTVMTGNPSFTTPIPTLASITTAINNLELSYNAALSGGKALTAVMHEKRTILDTLLTQLGHYVEAAANGSEAIILSAGMNVKANGVRRRLSFEVRNGKNPGEMLLNAEYMSHRSYIWQMVVDPLPDETTTVDPAHTWLQMGVSPKASFVVPGLEVSKKYWFRYSSVGKDGQSAWSDPLGKMVTE